MSSGHLNHHALNARRRASPAPASARPRRGEVSRGAGSGTAAGCASTGGWAVAASTGAAAFCCVCHRRAAGSRRGLASARASTLTGTLAGTLAECIRGGDGIDHAGGRGIADRRAPRPDRGTTRARVRRAARGRRLWMTTLSSVVAADVGVRVGAAVGAVATSGSLSARAGSAPEAADPGDSAGAGRWRSRRAVVGGGATYGCRWRGGDRFGRAARAVRGARPRHWRRSRRCRRRARAPPRARRSPRARA